MNKKPSVSILTPRVFIARIKDLFPEGYKPLSGGCMKFHKLLKEVFPQAVGYYDHNHIITEIDGKFYDITGEVEKTWRYYPFEVYGYLCIQKQFEQHIKI